MSDPYQIVRDFEAALCDYTGAPYCVTTTSCTMALLLAVRWHLCFRRPLVEGSNLRCSIDIEIPKRTYVGVPMSIIHAGGRPTFSDDSWSGIYQLKPLPVWDSARLLTGGMYLTPLRGSMVCLSFHHTKHLGLAGHGGAILHDDAEADYWLRRARFDGRQEGIEPRHQTQAAWIIGWHCYMTPAVAAEGLMRLAVLPRNNDPLPPSDYPDLSTLDIFKGGTS